MKRRIPARTALVGLLVAPVALSQEAAAQQTPTSSDSPPPAPKESKPADDTGAPAIMQTTTVTGSRPSDDKEYHARKHESATQGFLYYIPGQAFLNENYKKNTDGSGRCCLRRGSNAKKNDSDNQKDNDRHRNCVTYGGH